jgi:hypothetical protein
MARASRANDCIGNQAHQPLAKVAATGGEEFGVGPGFKQQICTGNPGQSAEPNLGELERSVGEKNTQKRIGVPAVDRDIVGRIWPFNPDGYHSGFC